MGKDNKGVMYNMKERKKGLVGKRFGRLTVTRDAGKDKQGQLLWRCECKCGREISVKTQDLQRGLKKHCGCLDKETLTKFIVKNGYQRLFD